MKKIILYIIATLLLSSWHNPKEIEVSFMTYNVRYGLADDGQNSWKYRKEFLADQINFYNPDFLGTQEGLPFQVKYIDSQWVDHSFIGEARDGNGKGEYSAIFYNTTKFTVKNQRTFWLSPTPDQVSKGWDAAYPRICTYALFTHKASKTQFWLINTHLDHVGAKSRKKSISIILKKIKAMKKATSLNIPLVFMGDLNAEPQSKPIQKLKKKLNDSKGISLQNLIGPTGTFNNFKFQDSVNKRIDYIFVSQNITVNKYAVLSDSKDLKYPSDHLPVYIEVRFSKSKNQ